jgi:adenosylcobyric acid synthase
LFDTPEGVSELITWLATNSQIKPIDINLNREQQLSRLASVVAENLDIEQIINIYENFNLET